MLEKYLEKCSFLKKISSMVLGLIDQLQILRKLFLLELLGLSIDLGLVEL